MSAAERLEKSRRIAEHVAGLPGMLLGFAPLRTEPDWLCDAVWPRVAFPQVVGERLEFYRASCEAELERGAHGTREPRRSCADALEPSQARAILVPGLAFTCDGARLGRGGGFYDRFLAEACVREVRRVGVCFACQLVPQVPCEPHDQRVDAVVTENGWIESRSNECGRD